MSPKSSPPFEVLYVEDNPTNLELVEHIFGIFSKVKLISAQNGKEGIRLAEENSPDLILMDINLPGENGIEIFRRLKLSPTTRDIPVMAVSANAMQKDIDQALNEGFVDYLTKPFDINSLIEKMGNILGCDLTNQ